jgi:hypothetical protein
MKRFFVFAAMMLGLASCQNETNIFGVNVNTNEKAVEFTITATAPEFEETRAAATYKDSGKSGLHNGALSEGKTLRYILEIYDEAGNRSNDIMKVYTTNKTATFNPSLVPERKYTFVVWADIVDATAKTDVYYNTADLTNVTLINDAWLPMDEARDAFTGVTTIENLTNQTIDIPLTRPFAKLRIVTKDKKEAVTNLRVTPTWTEVSFTDVPVYSFNAKEKTYTALTPATLAKSHAKFEIANYTDDSVTSEEEITLYTDYFFAPSDNEVALGTFTMNVYEGDGSKRIKSTTFSSSIPVKRNRLTTVKGNFLTIQAGDTGSFKITGTIHDEFGEGEKTIDIQ